MICDKRVFSIKGGCISDMVLLLVLLSVSGCEEPSAGQMDQKAKAFEAFLMKTPFVGVIAAAAYYGEFGRWPSSVFDLEALQDEDFEDVDWESLRDTIVFEELPDGGLKITSTDPHIRGTIALSAPSAPKEDLPSEDRPEATSLAPGKVSFLSDLVSR